MPRGASRDGFATSSSASTCSRSSRSRRTSSGRCCRRSAASTDVEPANLTPFLPDEDLESRRHRAGAGLGVFVRGRGRDRAAPVLVARAEPAEGVGELLRQERHPPAAWCSTPTRRWTRSTRPSRCSCAKCHGADGGGGTSKYRSATGEQVTWKEPPLNTVMLRFTEDPNCINPDDRAGLQCSVTDIITNGGPAHRCPRGA